MILFLWFICIFRAECACHPVRYFAILSMQRSGSGWFETLLNNHTNISSNGEIFSVKVRRSNISTIVETLDKLYNLDWVSSASKNECTAAIGLKWMLNQVRMSFTNLYNGLCFCKYSCSKLGNFRREHFPECNSIFVADACFFPHLDDFKRGRC